MIVLQFLRVQSQSQLILLKNRISLKIKHDLTYQLEFHMLVIACSFIVAFILQHFIHILQIQIRHLFIIFMIDLSPNSEALRIFLIGLPYCGIQDVAQILRKDYGLSIFRVNLQQKKKDMSTKKFIRQICYKGYKQNPKAVVITTEYKLDILLQLKKRNYLNIVHIDATFKQRLSNFLKQNKKEESLETIKEFMDIDAKFHNEEYEQCLELVRVRLLNSGNEMLRDEIKRKEKDVIRYFRPTWDQYFMKIADIARRRSNCMKTSVGAVIVNDENRVVSTGYNGTPKQIPSCYKLGCDRCNKNQGKQLDQCLCLHAEESAIIEVGIGKTEGCRLYTTYYPCFSCAKIIKQAGIKKIYYMDEYEKQDSGKPFIENYFHPQDVVKISADNLYY